MYHVILSRHIGDHLHVSASVIVMKLLFHIHQGPRDVQLVQVQIPFKICRIAKNTCGLKCLGKVLMKKSFFIETFPYLDMIILQ